MWPCSRSRESPNSDIRSEELKLAIESTRKFNPVTEKMNLRRESALPPWDAGMENMDMPMGVSMAHGHVIRDNIMTMTGIPRLQDLVLAA